MRNNVDLMFYAMIQRADNEIHSVARVRNFSRDLIELLRLFCIPISRVNVEVVILVGARYETDARLVVKFKNGLGDYAPLVPSCM